MSRTPEAPSLMRRRTLLKKAAATGAIVWAAPAIDSFVSVAAAASGNLTVGLYKHASGNVDPTLLQLCTIGSFDDGVRRGSILFERFEDTPTGTICVTITITSGPAVNGREVYILQSDGATCLSNTTTPVPDDTWPASPASGTEQRFCTDILPGADTFVVALRLSGGGGTDGYASFPPVTLA